MREGNVIKFGYGDVVLGSNGCGYIQITNIKPPVKCGDVITKELAEKLERIDTITIVEDKPYDLYNLAKRVNEDNKVFEYKEYVFDFTNYNEESVLALKRISFNMVNHSIYAS